MTEKLIAMADENLETTKNESRPSEIGLLQILAIKAFPVLAAKHLDCFFTQIECYPKKEKINEVSLNSLDETLDPLLTKRDIESIEINPVIQR